MKTPPNRFLTLRFALTAALSTLAVAACSEVAEESTSAPVVHGELRAQTQLVVCGEASGVPCEQGWIGAYYDERTFDDLFGVRIDETINFNWGNGRPIAGMGSNHFSSRWFTYLTPQTSGDYRFWVESDDGVQLALDGQIVVDDLNEASGHGPRWVAGDWIALEAGRSYAALAESIEFTGGAMARLYWQRAGEPDSARVPVPASVTGLIGAGQGVQLTWYEDGDSMRNGAGQVATGVHPDLAIDLEAHRPVGLSDGFAARATGFVEPLYPGDYTFEATCSGGARLTVLGQTTGGFDRAGALGTYTESFSMPLSMGRRARVILEMFDTDGSVAPGCTVTWQNAYMGNGSAVPVPDAALYPATFGRGIGLEGRYYDNRDGTNLLNIQVDSAVAFNWGSQAPILDNGVVMGSNDWRIDWEGEVEAVTTGDHTLYGVADNGIDVWLATSWSPRSGSPVCGADRDCGYGSRCIADSCEDPVFVQLFSGNNEQATVALNAGERYPIRVRHTEFSGNASVALEWSAPGLPREVVPSTQLHPPTRFAADGLGLEGHYFPYRFNAPLGFAFDPTTSNAQVVRTDATVNFDWGSASPAPEVGFPSNNFMVRWVGQVRPRYSELYTFRTFTDDGIRLWVNGELLIDNWSNAGEESGTIELVAGKRYDIHMAYYEGGSNARARLLWESNSQAEEHIPQSRLFPPPRLGAGTGMLGEYFGSPQINEDDLRLVRIDPSMDVSYSGSPANVIPNGPHAVRWRGSIEPIFDETYTLTVRSNGGARIYIGDVLAADAWDDNGDSLVDVSTTVELRTGELQDITIEYRQQDASATLQFLWESASQVQQLIPTRQMYPAEPTSRVAFGQCRSVLSIEQFDDGTGLPEGLEQPVDDGLQLSGYTESRPDLWVANTNGQTLTRIDTSNGNVIATYPAGKDASRTAVDLDYNAWVANRAFGETGTVTKVLSVNADGTSCECCSEYDDEGTCIYYSPLDLCGECVAYTLEFENNSLPRGLAVDAQNNVWVGLYNTNELVEIANCPVDPVTGVIDYDCANPICQPDDTQCIARATELGNDCSGTLPNNDCRGDQQLASYHQAGLAPYGLAIDQEGYIWVANWGGTRCFDTKRREFCGRYRRQWAADSGQGCDSTYGIAVNADGDIWWGNYACGGGLTMMDRQVWRQAVDDNTDETGAVNWAAVESIVNHQGTYQFSHPNGAQTRGVAVDGNGIIWVASSGTNRVLQFDPSLPAPADRVQANATCVTACNNAGGNPGQLQACYDDCGPVPDGDWIGSYPTCSNPIGVGISDEGDAWAVCRSSQLAEAFRPDGTVRFTASTGSGPYSYSDMTGFQLRNFTAPQGEWSRVFDCVTDGGEVDENGRCLFDYLTWDSVTPPGAQVVVRVRAGDADASGEIQWGEWSAEYAVTPAPLGRDGYEGRYVEVEVTLVAAPRGASPVLNAVQLWQCPQLYPPINFDVEDRWIVDQAANNYAISWQFTDDSWPEEYFQMVDEDNNARCQVVTETSYEKGDHYSGNAPLPGCTETGHISNTPITRWPQAVNRYNGEWLFSPLGEPVTYYTLTNNPIAESDVRLVQRTDTSLTVNWCKPQRNWLGGLTGAQIERSTSPTFDGSVTVLAAFPNEPNAGLDARGYADADAFCGNYEDTGLLPGVEYFYRLTYQNGDGVPSAPAVVSGTTYGTLCCEELETCVGVCGDSATTGDGSFTDEICEEPPTYEEEETLCDGLDNDCDGETDEGLTNACGLCGPLPVEICDGLDNDCDGTPDNNPVDGTIYYRDRDGDSWGDLGDTRRACTQPPGYVSRPGDCNDNNAAINPDAEELCDGIDNNCDGNIDETGEALEFYADTDSDGYGDPLNTILACAAPPGYTSDDTDCDDTTFSTNPGAPELCDGVDNDCDDTIDEGFSLYELAIDTVTTVADVGLDACDNAYDGEACDGAAAIQFTVTNDGTTPLASTTEIRFTMDTASGEELYPYTALPRAVAPGAAETFTFCFGHGQNVAAEDNRAVVGALSVPAGAGCGLGEAQADDVTLYGGAEICDGLDNDCDGNVDESPDACGALMICVENAREEGDDYLCVFRLTAESSDCIDGVCGEGEICDPSGACVYGCDTDADCSAGAECHQNACISSAWIDDAAAATAEPDADDAVDVEADARVDVAEAGAPSASPSASTGCAAARGTSSSSAGWAGGLLALVLWRRRRRVHA